MTKACICDDSNIIVNIGVWDDESTDPPGYNVYLIADDVPAAIGWKVVNGIPVDPNPPPPE